MDYFHKKIISVIALGLLLTMLVGFVGCGGGKTSGRTSDSFSYPSYQPPAPVDEGPDPRPIAAEDLQALDRLNEAGLIAYDRSNYHRFSQIFGGTTGRHVRAFIDQRVHHMVRTQDVVQVHPATLQHTGWLGITGGAGNSVSSRALGLSGNNQVSGNSNVHIKALNIGSVYWLQGLLDGVDYQFSLADGQTVSLGSPRQGVMLFGSGYVEQYQGQLVPHSYRQITLVHEARHFDCPGGITQEDLTRARSATSNTEFFRDFRRKQCLHLHSVCTSGTYRGIAACDSEIWGAYSISLVFTEAVMRGVPRGSTEWQLLNARVIDNRTRFLFDVDAMLRDIDVQPDLSNSGLLD